MTAKPEPRQRGLLRGLPLRWRTCPCGRAFRGQRPTCRWCRLKAWNAGAELRLWEAGNAARR